MSMIAMIEAGIFQTADSSPEASLLHIMTGIFRRQIHSSRLVDLPLKHFPKAPSVI